MRATDLLTDLLAGGAFDAAHCDRLVAEARRANLLGRVGALLEARGELAALDPRIRRHFDGARLAAERQAQAVRWEVERIREALSRAGLATLLLKGAAYALADLPPARGRTMSDIDILVPREALDQAESTLMLAGWTTTHHDAYDQRYYREWTHELPPMRHIVRGSVIDLHHALLPVTARLSVDSGTMRAAAIDIPGTPGLKMLSPHDMVLHAACHLFHEGELHNGLRDLSDLDLLLRHFGASPEFWKALVPRAEMVGLARPLAYALHYTTRVFRTPVPPEVLEAARRHLPAPLVFVMVDWLYRHAFPPRRSGAGAVRAWFAHNGLFVRGHWLRMPTGLLVQHLWHKAWARTNKAADTAADPAR